MIDCQFAQPQQNREKLHGFRLVFDLLKKIQRKVYFIASSVYKLIFQII